MRTFLDWVFAGVVMYFIIRTIGRIDYLFKLLEDLSDDINDIKKKLGLTVEERTKRQIDESNRHFIHKEVMKGKTSKELRRTFGFWGFRKYKWYIESCLEDYPDRKICPKCEKLYGKYADDCRECKDSGQYYGELVPFKKYKEKHPEAEGRVEEYDE